MAIKSEALIWLEYGKAISQANELDRIASEMKNLAEGDFQNCLSSVASNWTGDNSRNYIRKGEKLKGDIDKSARQLQNIAKAIRNIAKRTRNADLRAREIALSSGR